MMICLSLKLLFVVHDGGQFFLSSYLEYQNHFRVCTKRGGRTFREDGFSTILFRRLAASEADSALSIVFSLLFSAVCCPPLGQAMQDISSEAKLAVLIPIYDAKMQMKPKKKARMRRLNCLEKRGDRFGHGLSEYKKNDEGGGEKN